MGFQKLNNFLRNMKFLTTHNVEKHLYELLDSYKYELEDVTLIRPEILPAESAIDRLLNSGDSFVRFGNTELEVMKGRSSGFQNYDAELSRRLHEILRSNDENIMVGIPRYWFYYSEHLLDASKRFFRTWVPRHRALFIDKLDLSKTYYDSCCSCMYATYREMDFDRHFAKIREIWQGEKLTIICGKTVFDKIRPEVFDSADEVEYLYGPSINAFSEYGDILRGAKERDRDRLFITITGPAATVLAYDLARDGRRALDMGHVAKDYMYYADNVFHNGATTSRFFEPD